MPVLFYVNTYAKNNKYIYNYTDHLGNVRISFARNSAGVLEITDKNDYYPFGMNRFGTGNGMFGAGSYNNHKYNGKELQETGMYDYGARMYMADIGRWGVIDAMSEKYNSLSPYNYALNSPSMVIDPDGNDAVTLTGEAAQQAFSAYVASMSISSESTNRNYFTGFNFNNPPDNGGVWSSIKNFFSNLFNRKKDENTRRIISRTGIVGTLTTGSITFDGYLTGGAAATETTGAFTVGGVLTGGFTLGGILIPTMIGEPEFNWTRQFDRTIDTSISGEISRADTNRNGILLYRGVSSFAYTETQAIMYNEALFGIAIPNGLRTGEIGHWNMDDHSASDNYSVFTSWTSNPSVARDFATDYGTQSGVILSKRFKIGVNAIPNVSKNARLMQEGEWLIFGPIIRANVQHVKP